MEIKKETTLFFKNLFIYLVIIFIMIIVLNFCYQAVSYDKKVTYIKISERDKYLNAVNEINYAFFGDSHPENDINPARIPGSYNFGGLAGNYAEVYHELTRTVENGTNIKNLILQIDFHTFSVQEEKQRYVEVKDYYCKLISYSEAREYYTNTKLFSYLRCKHDWFFGGGGQLIAMTLKSQRVNITELGWMPFEGNFSNFDREQAAIKKYNEHFGDTGFDLNSSVEFLYFKKTLQYAIEHNMSIVFVKYPVSSYYDEQIVLNGLDKNKLYSELFEKVNEITKCYCVLDYYSYFNNTDYFGDADHLNVVGANIFSEKINEDLKTLTPETRVSQENLLCTACF